LSFHKWQSSKKVFSSGFVDVTICLQIIALQAYRDIIAPALRAAILLYDGMISLDAIDPYEVLSRVPVISIDWVGKTGISPFLSRL